MPEEVIEAQATEVVSGIQPMDLSKLESPLGMYAPFEVSPEDMYGPAELGEDYAMAIKKMCSDSWTYEEAARIWEVIQATESRLFDRGYQWLTTNRNGGWVIAGTGGNAQASTAISKQDLGRMWAVNMYGARKDKIVAALTVKDPEPEFFPKRPDSALDQRAAEESDKYKHLWKQVTNVRSLCNKVGGLFYTDDRTALITESIADAQRFGMEGDMPGIGEVTRAYGKLEFRVPMSLDEDEPLPWCCRSRELDIAVCREKYQWLSNIQAGTGGNGQIDRTCRLTVRNAVSGQTTYTSNTSERAVTETTYWVRPSQYRDVVDKEQRQFMRQTFPDGMRIVFVGGEFAYCRNEKMEDCVIILYSREGTGQNRRAIGTNNLTTQKILNYDFSLFNRFMTACVPRKMHDAHKINSEAINQQRSDPGFSIPVERDANEDISSFTGIEQVPTAPPQLFEFIGEMMTMWPQELDGASPAMFGGTDGTDTVGGITIQRDQALQVFGTPYNALTWGIAISCQNAARWAGKTRQGEMSGMVPGVGRITVDFTALGGDTYCFPQADSGFPESEAEKEQRLTEAIDASANLPALAGALNDPINFLAVDKVTKRFGVRIPGADSVRKQQEEFEFILSSAPVPNPMAAEAGVQLQELTEQAANDPQAHTPVGQQMMQQAQQAVSQIPQVVCSVPVEQDASVNHAVEAATCFYKINSPEGQKLKREKPKFFQNLMLHWQGHADMAAKLAPPPPDEVRKSVTMSVDKMSPDIQSQIVQKEYGLDTTPEQADATGVHEIVQEKEGVDANGVPVKQKISFSGKALN